MVFAAYTNPGVHGMGKAYGLESAGGLAGVLAGRREAGIARRRSLRVALLSLAAAILLLGAAIAGVFGYRAISGATPAPAAFHAQQSASARTGR
jgi:uncharacterized membrane protein